MSRAVLALEEVIPITSREACGNLDIFLFQSSQTNRRIEPSIQKAPTEIILQIFQILRQEHDQSLYPIYLHSAFSKSDSILSAICFALTCKQYWIAFREIWCKTGTNWISSPLPLHQKLSLALLLKEWVGPEYRCASFLSWEKASVPMFLSRKIYGQDGSPAETRLMERYQDYPVLATCQATEYTALLPRHPLFHDMRGVLSPFGVGNDWYGEAARQYLFGFQCSVVDWNVWNQDRNDLANYGSWDRDQSWQHFRQTSLYEWIHSSEAEVPTSELQADIKQWLRSFEKDYEKRWRGSDSNDSDFDSGDSIDNTHESLSRHRRDSIYLYNGRVREKGGEVIPVPKYKDPYRKKWKLTKNDVLSSIHRLYNRIHFSLSRGRRAGI